VVIVTATQEIAEDESFVGVAITGTIQRPLPKVCVRLPWHRRGHPRTGLSKPCVARCDWLVEIRAENVSAFLGIVPPKQLRLILETVGRLAP
jgi:hypothetical protein